MSDTYTPDEEQVREQYTQEQPPQIGAVAEKHAEFDRFIDKVKADALRGAIEDIDAAGLDAYTANEFVTWLSARADRIGGEQ